MVFYDFTMFPLFPDTQPHFSYTSLIKKRVLITFALTNSAMLVLRQAGDGGLALPQEPTTIHLPFANLLPFEETCPPSFISNHTGMWPLSVSEPHVWGGAG
jgi:hypothetical protein